MLRPVRTGLLAITASAFAIFPASSGEADQFVGKYVMQGKGFAANDTAYSGTCTIAKQGMIYSVSCFNDDTRHTYTGKGLAKGAVLSVLIGDTLRGDHNEIYAGEYIVLYERDAVGKLTGVWAHASGPAHGAETLTPVP